MITFILAVCGNVDYVYSFPLSPPSRAAWIEILYLFRCSLLLRRRRLHGRRGLKCKAYKAIMGAVKSPPSRAAWIEIVANLVAVIGGMSPPSRAAWIEMQESTRYCNYSGVAAFTGGVD